MSECIHVRTCMSNTLVCEKKAFFNKTFSAKTLREKFIRHYLEKVIFSCTYIEFYW